MLQVVACPLKIGETEERTLGHFLWGRGHDGVLDHPAAAKHPHEVNEVIRCHSLIKGNTKLEKCSRYKIVHNIIDQLTAHDVITHRKQCKISSKIHFRMANKTSVQMCSILKPQLQLFQKYCADGCLFTWFILSPCQLMKKYADGPTKQVIEFVLAMKQQKLKRKISWLIFFFFTLSSYRSIFILPQVDLLLHSPSQNLECVSYITVTCNLHVHVHVHACAEK